MPTSIVGARPGWPTLGLVVAEWAERWLCHGVGDVQEDAFVFDDEEIALLCDLYRVHPAEHPYAGRRVVRRGVYSRSKGRRKSEIAALLVCAEALGPVRFAGWDKAGRPKGKRVRAPFIRCLATEETQASNTYDHVRVMLTHALERHGDRFAGVDVGLTRTLLAGGGEIRPSTAASASKDGGRETFAVADETHLYTLDDLRGMHRTVSRNLMKRRIAEPWMLDTTTAFEPGALSIAETAADQAQSIAEGRVKGAGFYRNHREGTEVVRWSDDSQVMASLREAYGPAAAWMDLPGILENECRNADASEPETRRYWLNQVVKASTQWLDPAAWAACERPATVEPRCKVTLGFDGARFEDATALVACRLDDGYTWPVGIWEKPPGAAGDGWEVDVAEVDAAVHAAMGEFSVVRLYADPPYWQDQVSGWHATWGDTVVEWWTNRDRPMAAAFERFHTAVTTSELTHDGDATLARHVGNARRRESRSGPLIRKERPSSPRKIDGAMAAVLAWEARADAIAAGAMQTKRRRAWAW